MKQFLKRSYKQGVFKRKKADGSRHGTFFPRGIQAGRMYQPDQFSIKEALSQVVPLLNKVSKPKIEAKLNQGRR